MSFSFALRAVLSSSIVTVVVYVFFRFLFSGRCVICWKMFIATILTEMLDLKDWPFVYWLLLFYVFEGLCV